MPEFIHQFVKGTSPVTILALHGTGGDENDLLPIVRSLAPGASVLSPRGRVSERGAFRFFARLAPGVFDEKEIRVRAAELAEWISSAVTEHGLDPAQIYALGYSNGANIATALMLLHPGVVKGAVLLRPMAVIRPEPLPALADAPVLLVAGNQDSTMQAGEADKLGRMLAEAGAAVDFAMQDAGHELTPQDFTLVKRWLAERLAQATGSPALR
ncbi:MAG: phospholipase/carboxylesterase [Bryobacterales bacterium]|jgi:predicted esterase|nr:phospholipase/carboxylesterase [Bryobacterales bacterium]